MTGKEKCKYLKELRAAVAAAYKINGFEYKECEFKGDCNGTCPACDAEAQLLYQKLQELGHDLDVNALKSSEQEIKIRNNSSENIMPNKPRRLAGKTIQRPRNDDRFIMEGKIKSINTQTAGVMLPPEHDVPNDTHTIKGNMQKITPNNPKEKTDNVKEKPRGLRGLFKKKK